MLEYFILLFVFSSAWIVWLRPAYYALKFPAQKEWVEYWCVLAVVGFAEFHFFNEISRQIAYNFVRTMSLFVISERAVAKCVPKTLKKPEPEEPEEMNCDNLAEKLYFIESLSEKTPIKVISQLLSSTEDVPFQFEKKNSWAAFPVSTRAFVAYKLAALVSSENFKLEKIEQLRDCEIPQKFIEMLDSNSPGDRDNALLALTYLVEKSKKLQKCLFQAHIFDHFQNLLAGSGPATMAALRVCRSIFKTRVQAKNEFMRLKYSFDMIRIIRTGEKNDVVDATYAANELVMIDGNQLNRGMLQVLANQGLYDAIQAALNAHGADSKVKLQLKCLETLIISG